MLSNYSNITNSLKLSKKCCFILIVIVIFIFVAFNMLQKSTTPRFIYDDRNELHCDCERSNQIQKMVKKTSSDSLCGMYATLRGPGQKVVSYSFYGKVTNEYFPGLECNAKAVREKYPGWVMRIYHNLNTNQSDVHDEFCKLWCTYSHIDFCHVEYLPAPLYNKSQINPRAWRFFAMGDPLVERFISRDADHRIMDREVAAVNQWIESRKSWHFMHDYPSHKDPAFGGMFGGVNSNLTLNMKILEAILVEIVGKDITYDQTVLGVVLIPIVEKSGDYMNHDSYNCGVSTKLYTPWPTQRPATNIHVGVRCVRIPGFTYELKDNPCPPKCRPPDHQDWLYC